VLYIHLYAIFSSKFGNFIHILENFGVGLASFLCFGSKDMMLPHYFWCNLVVNCEKKFIAWMYQHLE
jgi:hypothetical protein